MIVRSRSQSLQGVVCLASISKGEQGDKLRRLAAIKDEEDKIRQELGEIDTIQNWVSTMPIMDDYEVAMSVSKI